MSTVKAYKVQSAAMSWENSGENLDAIVEKIKGMQQKIEDFYDWKISRGDDGMKRLEVPIRCDVLKLENHIPLFSLTSVFDFAHEVLSNADNFNGLLQKMYKLSPFYQ
jgi:hypothetical protein